jgi:hypothetical protein
MSLTEEQILQASVLLLKLGRTSIHTEIMTLCDFVYSNGLEVNLLQIQIYYCGILEQGAEGSIST